MGERHCCAGGAGTFTACMASRSLLRSSASSRLTFREGLSFASAIISSAVFFPTREKLPMRNSSMVPVLAAAIRFNAPNSIPCGWGRMGFGHGGTSPETRSNTVTSPSISAVIRACGLTIAVRRR